MARKTHHVVLRYKAIFWNIQKENPPKERIKKYDGADTVLECEENKRNIAKFVHFKVIVFLQNTFVSQNNRQSKQV